jgi:hypothetical protein
MARSMGVREKDDTETRGNGVREKEDEEMGR